MNSLRLIVNYIKRTEIRLYGTYVIIEVHYILNQRLTQLALGRHGSIFLSVIAEHTLIEFMNAPCEFPTTLLYNSLCHHRIAILHDYSIGTSRTHRLYIIIMSIELFHVMQDILEINIKRQYVYFSFITVRYISNYIG